MAIDIIIIATIITSLAALGWMDMRNIINPITLFCGVWGAILIMYSFQFYGLYSASWESIVIIAIGIMSFFIGSIIIVALKKKYVRRNSVNIGLDINTRKPNYLLFIILNIISIIMLIGSVVETIGLLREGRNFAFIHSFYHSENGSIGSSTLMTIFHNWFIWPITLANLPILAVTLQCDLKRTAKRKIFVITSFINIAIYVLITGARVSIIYFVMYFVIVFFIQGKRISLSLPRKIQITVVTILLYLAFDYISRSRGSESIAESIYLYFCGCIPNFSVRFTDIPNKKMYGFLSLFGLFKPFVDVIYRITHFSVFGVYKQTVSEIFILTQHRVHIGPGITYNAFLTPFYYFYIDGGVLGVVVLSFLYGIVSMVAYLEYIKKRSYKTLSIYLLFVMGMVFSMVRFHFVQMRYVLAFFYIAFVFWEPQIILTFGNSHLIRYGDKISGEKNRSKN